MHFVHSLTHDDFKGQDTVLKETGTTEQHARWRGSVDEQKQISSADDR